MSDERKNRPVGSVSSPLSGNHPAMIAWNLYKTTSQYENSRRWASDERHVDGSMFAAFWSGWEAGDEAGARRVRDAEREAILRFIRDNGMWWTWGTILAAIERGEHRGGK